jgi:D-alanine-D-alanine ligase
VVVKPPRDGSSFGVSIAKDRGEFASAVEEGLRGSDGRVLVERRLVGTEVTCPVLGNRGGKLTVLPLVEIVPRNRALFDFQAKYEGGAEEICPARVGDDVAQRVREAAMTAHRVLGCDGVSRSDFIVDADGRPWYLETNTVPGMTEQSLCPLSARTAGISFPRLCEMLVELAIERAGAERR